MEQAATERWTVPSRLSAVPTARRWAARFLSGRGLPEDLVDTVELLVSELVTNAVRHADTGAVSVALRIEPTRLLVEVQDDDPLPPSLVTARPGDVGGRGIGMLALAGAEWGVTDRGTTGKAVWFALPLTSTES
ncbi:ATP-binding protein [Cellulomonas sp. RIT-PI-Y]|jgi:anti-sigma regulatory factor (Ser/Thr protein kinase)|uniref:ATP-binding protein n=1 Tax=Cellulomonas sp. RIT-PI-Y TaxID=3035297 RepID=UPI0021D90A27|nr:ATP-binding protein [Cellulomonas sp. RIT-PI-Y]